LNAGFSREQTLQKVMPFTRLFSRPAGLGSARHLMLLISSIVAVSSPLLPDTSAHEVIYAAALSGPNESPANNSTGIGIAKITLDFDLFTMRVEASFNDLQGTVTASHIHAATAIPFSGTAGVATQTPTFSGFPTGVTNGSYDHTFDLTQAESYNPAFIAANGGTISTASNAFFNALAQGRAYFNIHTSMFPGGEVRGFLIEPVGIVSITRAAANTIHLECFGRAEFANRIEASPDLNPTNFTTLAEVKTGKDGTFEYNDTNPGTRKFYRVARP
jgi:hypothetical protein